MEGVARRYRATAHAWLRRPCDSARYRAHSVLFACALAIRLTLPDAFQGDWLWLSLLGWLAVVLLAVNGNMLGWLLTAVVTLGGLLFLSDQLSQSVFLLASALAALGCWAGSKETRSKRLAEAMPRAIRWLTVSVYLFAALHKLNRDFFQPQYSCANAGIQRLFEGMALMPQVASWSGWPKIFIVCELLLALSFVLRPRLAVLFALWFHLPLTIIFAPAFAFTMATGWLCFLGDDELPLLAKFGRRRIAPILAVAAGLFAARMYFFFPGRWATDPDWCVKEQLLFVMAVGFTFFAWSQGSAWLMQSRAPGPKTPRSWMGPAFACLYAANAATPYFGLQFHHTGAMLSNLRIDDGCHNSLVLPKAMRLYDPYVRVERVEFASHRAAPGYAAKVRERLWSRRALWKARRRWCRVHSEKLAILASYRGRSYPIPDFCSLAGWPFGRLWLPSFRAYQVNLRRSCPQACLH